MSVSRDIKFRAWNKSLKILSKAYSLNDLRLHNIEGYLEKTDKHLVWQQYIGLKDKNGKEIYEGDVVKFSRVYNSIGNKKDVVGVCEFISDDDVCSHRFSFTSKGVTFFAHERCKVIGNIYENPELLENK